MKTITKLILALLLAGCLLKMPYGYYQFIRIAGCVGFFYLAYEELKLNRFITGIFCVVCAILLNPVYKIYFSRKIWNIIDVIIAAILILWVITDLLTIKKRPN